MTVRRARPADARPIAAVQVASWRAAYRGIVPDTVLASLSVDERTARWESILADGGGVTWVAEDEGTVVGFASAAPPAEIAALYVDPACWRRGHGRALLAAAIEHLREAGASEATLWVFADNAGARRFYAAAGFEPDGAEDVHDASGAREVRLRAPLERPPEPP